MSEYRVNLDIYNGPLDLLLYLIKRDELDIHDIPIARITEQYLAYVEMLKQLDPNLAGEFLVMAASLVEIKSRMLLPSHEIEGGDDEDLAIDPREELVRQLLEYKAFKDAAHDLADAADVQSMRFPRRPAGLEEDDEKDSELDDLDIWDLFDAFRGVLDAIGQMSAHHEVIVDDTPQELYREDLLDRIRRDGALPFSRIFEGRRTRGELIGLFLALLELCKLRKLRAYQTGAFGDIEINLREDSDEDLDDDRDDETASADSGSGRPADADSSFSGGRHDRPAEEDTREDRSAEAFEPPVGEEVKATRYVREVEDDDSEPDDVLAADRQAREELDAIPEIDIDERLAEYEELREQQKAAAEEYDDADGDIDDDDEFDDEDFDDEDDDEDFDEGEDDLDEDDGEESDDEDDDDNRD